MVSPGLDHYLEHFRMRVIQDALNEATAAYWEQRAEAFSRVGTSECDEIAQACRNRAALSPLPGISEEVAEAVRGAA